jgi:hypothetical protein
VAADRRDWIDSGTGAGRRVRLRAVGLLLGRKREHDGCEVGSLVFYLSNSLISI